MRIVYTNLKENDAGRQRSVRQLQVDTGGSRSVPQKTARETLTLVRRVDVPPERVTAPAEEAEAAARPVLLEGVAALRAALIKRFVDVKAFGAAKSAGFCVTV